MQTPQVGTLLLAVVGGLGTSAPDVDLGTEAAEGLGDAIADTTGATDYQDGLAGEVERIGKALQQGNGRVVLGHVGNHLG
ncbi:hypothetical protein D3C80_1434040 [compost metagenome]